MRFLALLPLALASQLPFAVSPSDALLPFPLNSLHPSHVVHSLELAGALTRATTVYTLKRGQSDAPAAKSDWIVGIKGQEGFVEALIGQAGKKTVVEMTRLGKGVE